MGRHSGFASGVSRTYLQRGGHYVLAERLRSGSAEARAALSRAGRFRRVAGSLEVKEVRLGAGTRAQRFVLCHNVLAHLESQIAGSNAWPRSPRDELLGALRTHPAL